MKLFTNKDKLITNVTVYREIADIIIPLGETFHIKGMQKLNQHTLRMRLLQTKGLELKKDQAAIAVAPALLLGSPHNTIIVSINYKS